MMPDNKSDYKILIHPALNSKRTLGQKAADNLTKWAGSWSFILIFLIITALWILANIYMWTKQWDPYPFILLTLVLSMIAALQAPVILMSQNRQSQRDRIRAEYDYSVNRKAAREVNEIKTVLARLERKIK